MNKWLSVVLCGTAITLSGCNGSSFKEAFDKVEAEEKIRKLINDTMKEDQIPGMALALVSDEKTLFAKGFGHLDTSQLNEVGSDTPFWLGSISKAVMGTAIMHARDQQLLSLDTSVPETLAQSAPFVLASPETDSLTLRHLATHTGGITDNDYYGCAYYTHDAGGNIQYLVSTYTDITCSSEVSTDLAGYLHSYLAEDGQYYDPANFTTPGEQQYSNIGAALAGYTLELKTGQSLADYAQYNLFSPMGMTDTSWKLSDFDTSRIARPHMRSDTGQPIPLPLYSLSTWPDGGLRSSARDLAVYLRMMMNQGKHNDTRIIRSDSAALMQATLSGDHNNGHGIFWYTVTSYGRTLKGHSGSDPGAFSMMFYDPDKSLGLVLLANGDDDFPGMDSKYQHLMEKLLDYAEDLN